MLIDGMHFNLAQISSYYSLLFMHGEVLINLFIYVEMYHPLLLVLKVGPRPIKKMT